MDEKAFVLEIEKETIGSTDNFLSLFVMYIASIYCFNLVYPKKIEKSMLFIQKIILGLVDNETSVDRKLLNVLSELKSVKQ